MRAVGPVEESESYEISLRAFDLSGEHFLRTEETGHQAATAVAVARALRARGHRAAPAFWIASDDADLEECGTSYAPGPDRATVRATLEHSYAHGVMAGDVPLAEVEQALRRLLGEQDPRLRSLVTDITERAEDCGSWLAALLLRLFADDGLVVVDSRSRSSSSFLDASFSM